ncbi:hypothetical protein FHG87_023560 [Trinorchestia longiramus]|nr:hypothetical protein FHG87_023560 [Trinorchestia longiramus]
MATLSCVVLLVVVVVPCAVVVVGAESGSLAGAYSVYFGIVVITSPSLTEVPGESLCMCQYVCSTDPTCQAFSYRKGRTEAENLCYIPASDSTIISYNKREGYTSFVKGSLSKLVFTLGNITYHFVSAPTTFPDAPSFCPLGTRLACPSNTDNYEELREYIGNSGEY